VPTAIATNISVVNPRLQWSHAGDAIAYMEFATDALSNVKIVSTIGAVPVTIPLVSTPVWSPDDQQIAVVRPNQGLYVVDRDGNNLRAVADPVPMEAGFGWPDWSADGSKILYCGGQSGHGLTINTVNKDATDDRVIVDTFDAGEQAYWPRFSPDGAKLSFVRAGNGLDLGGYLVIANADGSQARQFPTVVKFGNPGFSPDGKYLIGFDYARANIVLIDAASGDTRLIPSTGTGNASWQRLALP
jgi:Tol biopolymer transport system component